MTGAVTVHRRMLADTLTPVQLYLGLADAERPSFLFESVTGGEHIGRYSFLGFGPYDGVRVPVDDPGAGDALAAVIAETERRHAPHEPGLPRFCGGAVGYLGFDTFALFEPLTLTSPEELDWPQLAFDYYDRVLAFDHPTGQLLLIANVPLTGDAAADAAAREAAEHDLLELERRIRALPAVGALPASVEPRGEPVPRTARGDFCQSVEAAKEHIRAGDAFQIVLSQRFSVDTDAEPFAVYRALRTINPSPYLFYLDLGGRQLIGASPELLVRVEDRHVEVRPIAGTRPRGATPNADQALADDLLADTKERAEHAMLVDLGRNDLGRVCAFGSVHVPQLMAVERYSHVMHLVSSVHGELAEGQGPAEALAAGFPAGTVSGAPKIRAIQILDRLEPVRRGPYAGAVGYLDFGGNLDTCIAIRTLLHSAGRVTYQAGAGIVADSDPEREFDECVNKSRALLAALRLAEAGLR